MKLSRSKLGTKSSIMKTETSNVSNRSISVDYRKSTQLSNKNLSITSNNTIKNLNANLKK